jgi:hypothetical protein
MSHHRIARLAVLALAVAAVAAPSSASARFSETGGGVGALAQTAATPTITLATPTLRSEVAATGVYQRTRVQPAILSIVSRGNGFFDWGSAGIGAAAIVLVAIATAGALTFTRRRTDSHLAS